VEGDEEDEVAWMGGRGKEGKEVSSTSFRDRSPSSSEDEEKEPDALHQILGFSWIEGGWGEDLI